MGCEYKFICNDCKKSISLGYTSYRLWYRFFYNPKLMAEDYYKFIEKKFIEHKNHNHFIINWENHTIDEKGNLAYLDYYEGEKIILENYSDYEEIEDQEDLEVEQ